MFVQEVALVDCPFDDVARRLAADAPGVLGAPALPPSHPGGELTFGADGPVAAGEAGERPRRRVRPEGWPSVLAPTVVVRVGPVRRREAALLVAFSWAPEGDRAASLLPSLDADLEVVPVGTSETALTVRGFYEPPAGALGRRVDGLVLHRLAEATVRSFLAGVRDRLDPTVRRSEDDATDR